MKKNVKNITIISFDKSIDVNINNSKSVPLSYVDPYKFSWALLTSTAVNKFFNQSYKKASQNSTYFELRPDNDRVVYRPNHSLAHGMRQAYLATDLALMFKHAKPQELNAQGQELCTWVQKQFKDDSNFLKKIFFTNAFQRSGWQSEIGLDDDPIAYEKYLLADQKNFLMEVERLNLGNGNLFQNLKEIEIYKEALVKKFDDYDPNFPEEVFYLSKLLYSVHLLDLRRLPHFNKDKILKNVSEQLFGREKLKEAENNLLIKAWSRTGDYLQATGDRDMEGKRGWDKELFYVQAKDPEALVHALELARSKPEEKLLNSLLSHVEVMRELKATQPKFDGDELPAKQKIPSESQQKAEDLRNNLKNAPYTASEAYLKLILQKGYKEIPKNCSDEIAKEIIRENLIKLLSKEQANDSTYVNILINNMMEERKQRDKIVLYHATDPGLAVLFDIFSHLRLQIIMQGGIDSVAILRAIDEEFMALNEVVSAFKKSAEASDFAKKYEHIKDSDRTYQAMGLATNFGLFGSNEEKNSNTYQMFYDLQNAKVTWSPPNYERLISDIEYKTGFTGIYSYFKETLDKFVLNENGKFANNRQLLQIFVDPQVLDETTYFSVIYGRQITKAGKQQLSLQQPLEMLRNHPEAMEDYLKNTSEPEKKGYLILQDLQARLFMKPEILLSNDKLITVKDYWRRPLANSKEYHEAIRSGVNGTLATWLKKGALLKPDVLLPETVKLPKFVQAVYQGSTGMQAPAALPFKPEQQLVDFLLKKQYDFAARFLEENYDLIKNKSFSVPIGQYESNNGQLDLTNLLTNCHISIAVAKVALDKDIFKGGDATYQFLLKLNQPDSYSLAPLVKCINQLSDPVKTIEIYNNYVVVKAHRWISHIIEILKGIDIIKCDETWLKAIFPFCYKNGDYYQFSELCKNLAKSTSDDENLGLFNDAISLFDNNYLMEDQMNFSRNIKSILSELKHCKNKLTKEIYEDVLLSAIKMRRDIYTAPVDDKIQFMKNFSLHLFKYLENQQYDLANSFFVNTTDFNELKDFDSKKIKVLTSIEAATCYIKKIFNFNDLKDLELERIKVIISNQARKIYRTTPYSFTRENHLTFDNLKKLEIDKLKIYISKFQAIDNALSLIPGLTWEILFNMEIAKIQAIISDETIVTIGFRYCTFDDLKNFNAEKIKALTSNKARKAYENRDLSFNDLKDLNEAQIYVIINDKGFEGFSVIDGIKNNFFTLNDLKQLPLEKLKVLSIYAAQIGYKKGYFTFEDLKELDVEKIKSLLCGNHAMHGYDNGYFTFDDLKGFDTAKIEILSSEKIQREVYEKKYCTFNELSNSDAEKIKLLTCWGAQDGYEKGYFTFNDLKDFDVEKIGLLITYPTQELYNTGYITFNDLKDLKSDVIANILSGKQAITPVYASIFSDVAFEIEQNICNNMTDPIDADYFASHYNYIRNLLFKSVYNNNIENYSVSLNHLKQLSSEPVLLDTLCESALSNIPNPYNILFGSDMNNAMKALEKITESVVVQTFKRDIDTSNIKV